MKAAVAFVTSLFAAARAGIVVWSGDFDYYNTANDFNTWSWANPVGEYQYYIHGSGPVTRYLDVSPSYNNPAIDGEQNGLKLSIDQTSTWNSAFWRTELIPQTNNNLGTGKKYYHFSVKRSSTNPPLFSYEHQVAFFESHFTELKVGISPNQTQLQWCVSGSPKYAVPFTPDVWYNFAYDIDFTGSTVGLWASTGSNPLQRVYAQTSATTYTNSADWHLGVLAFDQGTATEDWYFAGVYVEPNHLQVQHDYHYRHDQAHHYDQQVKHDHDNFQVKHDHYHHQVKHDHYDSHDKHDHDHDQDKHDDYQSVLHH
ncbi:hypothetical protein FS837_009819 [Tulasnella sp. UAMH 9824]|nr:hypothetical protein FS837_009819 [Tulasnella sp. UAMH 9824]